MSSGLEEFTWTMASKAARYGAGEKDELSCKDYIKQLDAELSEIELIHADHNLFHVIYFTLPESWSNVGSSWLSNLPSPLPPQSSQIQIRCVRIGYILRSLQRRSRPYEPSLFTMRVRLSLLTTAGIAAAQFTTSFQQNGELSITFLSSSTPRPASIPTTSISVYTPPVETIDSWLCVTKNFSDYLQPPLPTGNLLDVYYDHSDAIYKECEDKLLKPFTSYPAYPSIAKASWCAYVDRC